MLLPPGRGSRLLAAVLRITVGDKRPGRGRRAIAESLKHLSHQARDSGTVSSLAMKPTMDPVKLAAKEPLGRVHGGQVRAQEGLDHSLARQWSAGSSGGWGEACGYRWITMQVRVRVTPSTTWMRETTSRPS
jgi:hypothetical protein